MITDRKNPTCSAEILTLRGKDAAAFANAQFASKVDQLRPAQWQWTAWLGADGRVRLLGMLWQDNDGIHVLMRGGRAAQACTAMRAFVMRARVELAASCRALSPGEALPAGRLQRDGSALTFGLGDYSLCLAEADSRPGPRALACRHAVRH